jgi:hypothetical protein
MADPLTPGVPLPKPGIVDVLPVETVEPLIARHEHELRAMRLELADALREAEVAEQRLMAHPAAAVFNDAFEADVLAHVARSVATVGSDPPERAGRHTMAMPPEATPAGSPHDVGPGHDVVPEVATVAPGPLVEPMAEPAPPPSAPPPPARPRTVVVDRGAPRTVVVDRTRPAAAPPPPPPPPQPARSLPVSASDPGAEQYITAQANEGSLDADQKGSARGRGRTGTARNGHTSRLPARLLIQAGVVLVIVALLLLKLG